MIETQKSVHAWAVETFGPQDNHYRARNLLEEAVECGLAVGLSRLDIIDVVTGVLYIRGGAIGKVHEEIGDVLATLYALSEETNIDAHTELDVKMAYNKTRSKSYYEMKQKLKRAHGIIK